MKHQKTTTCLMATVIAAGLSVCLAPGRAAEDKLTANIEIRDMELSSVGPESFVVSARVFISPSRRVRLRDLIFDNVTFGGVRVQIPAIERMIELRGPGDGPGEPLEVSAVISYRSLETLEPLRAAIQRGDTRVHAEARAQLELSFFEKLALRSWGPWVAMRVDEDVPVSLPGGPLGKIAALAALTAADPVWVAGQGAQEWRRQSSAVAKTAAAEAPGRVAAIRTHYVLRSRDGMAFPLDVWSMGFAAKNGRIVAPAEVTEPWRFDEAQAEALSAGTLAIHDEDVEIEVWPLGEDSSVSYSLKRHEVRVVKELSGSSTGISLSTKKLYTLRFRPNDTNAVMLEIPRWKPPAPGLRLASEDSGEWLPAVLLRLDRSGAVPRTSLWVTEARLADGRYILKDPADPSVAGSPLWLGDRGVAGMMQDGNSALASHVLTTKLF